MPTVTNPGVIGAMVQAFLTNGMDKGQAGLSVGYSQSYVKNGNCAKLWDRPDVKIELKRQQLELIKKTGYTKEQAQYELEEARLLAISINQPSAAVSAINTNMRLHGMDQIAPSDATVIIINPPKSIESRKTVESETIENEM